MVNTQVDVARYISEDDVCEDVVPEGGLVPTNGDFGGSAGVSVTFNDCSDNQIGPTFEAEHITVFLPGVKNDSVVSKIIQGFNIEYDKSDKQSKSNRYNTISAVFMLFSVIFMCYILFQIVQNNEKLNSIESKQNITQKYSTQITPITETANLHLLTTEIPSISKITTEKSPNLKINRDRDGSIIKTSSKHQTITMIDNAIIGQDHAPNKTYASTDTSIKKPTKNTDMDYQNNTVHNKNTPILILSQITNSNFLITSRFKDKYVPNGGFKKVKEIEIQFFLGVCDGFPECLYSLLPLYSHILDSNFIIDSGSVVIIRGFDHARETFWLNKSLGILIFANTRDGISDILMYMYLLLINTASRCGYLERQFSVKMVGEQFYKNYRGFDKFMNIINCSMKDTFLVDDKDRFIRDTNMFSVKTRPFCGIFNACSDSCSNQECLQTVCDKGECFVQCM